MKEVVFYTGSFFGLIFGILACRFSRSFLYFFFSLLVISTLGFGVFGITFFSEPEYRGTTQGLEIKLALLCAFVLAVAMWQRPAEYRLTLIPPLTYVYMIYIIFGVISWWIVPSDSVLNPNHSTVGNLEHVSLFNIGDYPLYELAKIISGYLIFWTVANFFQNGKTIKVFALTMGAMLYYLAIASLVLRYAFGQHRVSAFSDTNVFNCYVGMLGTFVFPFALESRKNLEAIFYCGATLAAFLCIVLSISRSSLVGFGLACGFIIAANFYVRKMNIYKLLLVGFFVFCSSLILLKASKTLFIRFFYAEDVLVNLEERGKIYDIAKLMADEHFLGVGLNNFSAYSVFQYFPHSLDPGALAHNIWYLTLGEMGYIGLFSFILFWILYYKILVSLLFNKKIAVSVLFSTILGLIGANMILQFQDLVHFSYRDTSIFNLSHILMGATVGIYMVISRARVLVEGKE